jgi:hypothetical protein
MCGQGSKNYNQYHLQIALSIAPFLVLMLPAAVMPKMEHNQYHHQIALMPKMEHNQYHHQIALMPKMEHNQ